jgi:hypothetical protein
LLDQELGDQEELDEHPASAGNISEDITAPNRKRRLLAAAHRWIGALVLNPCVPIARL